MRISQISWQVHEPNPNIQEYNKYVTNSDTCCLGRNIVILNHTRTKYGIYPYDTLIKPVDNFPIISAETEYYYLITGTINIIVVNESMLYDENIYHSLINKNQVRSNGIGFWVNTYDYNKKVVLKFIIN